jgi:acetyl esterase
MLDPQLKAALSNIAASGAPDLADLPPPAAREMYRQIFAAGDLPPADVDVDNRSIAGPGGALALRVYTPRRSGEGAARGVTLYCHGGGFVLGSMDIYDSTCRTLCAESGHIVVAVEYRQAPEHPFPAAVDDCFAALRWLTAHAGEIGGDAGRLAVCGDSAGGNLAAVSALLARQAGIALRHQVLIYPVTSAEPGELASHREFGQGYVLSFKAMQSFTRHYFGADRAPDWRGAPLLADDLAALAPALVLVGAYDVLRDDGVAYAEALLEAGTPATLIEYKGLSHGFINMPSFLGAGHLALLQVAAALRLALRAG